VYDEEHTVTYCRMLDAEKASADWREVARIEAEADRARGAFDTHLRVQKWIARWAIDNF
jgi:hypothetical protein